MFMGDIFVRVVSTVVGSKVAILCVPLLPGDAGVEQVGGAGPVAEGLTRTHPFFGGFIRHKFSVL